MTEKKKHNNNNTYTNNNSTGIKTMDKMSHDSQRLNPNGNNPAL